MRREVITYEREFVKCYAGINNLHVVVLICPFRHYEMIHTILAVNRISSINRSRAIFMA